MLSDAALIWWLPLADIPEAAGPRLFAMLDRDERARAARFMHKADRFAFIVAHALLRLMLSQVARVDPRRWRFVAGPHGKPRLHPDHRQPTLEFNISHTRHAVACGISTDGPIGIDLESEDRTHDHLEIAEAFFAPAEIASLRAETVMQRPKLFLLLWTLKEAYVKARGCGLSLPLNGFAFSLAPITISFGDPGFDIPEHWRFESIRCTDSHRLSVAIRTPHLISCSYRKVSYNDIDRLAGF